MLNMTEYQVSPPYCVFLDLLVERVFLLLVLVSQVHESTCAALTVWLAAQPDIACVVEGKKGPCSHNKQVDTNVKLAALQQ